MELALVVYFANFVGSFQEIMTLLLIFGIPILCIYTIISSAEFNELKLPSKWVLFGIAAIMVLKIFVPNEKTVWLMAGAYGAQSVYESQTGKDIQKLVELKIKGIVDSEIEKATKK